MSDQTEFDVMVKHEDFQLKYKTGIHHWYQPNHEYEKLSVHNGIQSEIKSLHYTMRPRARMKMFRGDVPSPFPGFLVKVTSKPSKRVQNILEDMYWNYSAEGGNTGFDVLFNFGSWYDRILDTIFITVGGYVAGFILFAENFKFDNTNSFNSLSFLYIIPRFRCSNVLSTAWDALIERYREFIVSQPNYVCRKAIKRLGYDEKLMRSKIIITA